MDDEEEKEYDASLDWMIIPVRICKSLIRFCFGLGGRCVFYQGKGQQRIRTGFFKMFGMYWKSFVSSWKLCVEDELPFGKFLYIVIFLSSYAFCVSFPIMFYYFVTAVSVPLFWLWLKIVGIAFALDVTAMIFAVSVDWDALEKEVDDNDC